MKTALGWTVIVGGFIGAIYYLILLRAEVLFSRDTPISVSAAVHLQPANSEYLDRLATWLPQESQSLLKRSLAHNPYDSEALIRLGLLSELKDGDNAAAEKFYLQAARVNHLFAPKWTLTNFYFRQQNSAEFFRWAKETLTISSYESGPVFAQMWLMSQNAAELNNTIPDRPRILLQYAWYLTNTKHFDNVSQTVERLVRLTKKQDQDKWGRNDLLATSLDKMLAAGAAEPALRVWSILAAAGWLGEETVPTPQNPVSNVDFRERFYRHGFDWAVLENAGTRIEQYPGPAYLHISLYGDEAEEVTLLHQYLPVTPGERYQFSWQSESADMPDPSGVSWRLHPLPQGIAPDQVSGDLLAPQNNWSFTAPPNAKVLLLSLEYNRPLGTTRARGAFILKSVSMHARGAESSTF